MKKSRFTESQIVSAIKQHESGRKTEEICREYGISKATFYQWRKEYQGMEASDLRRLKALEEENRKLKRMYAELALDHQMAKEIIEKKL